MTDQSSIQAACPRSLRILCADDNATLGEIMRHMFTREGHLVERFGDGAEAWRRLSANIDGFDVVVTDHQMPGLTGLELVERLRAANFHGRIVVHTSGISDEEAARYRALGAAAVVPKVSTMDAMLRVVIAGDL